MIPLLFLYYYLEASFNLTQFLFENQLFFFMSKYFWHCDGKMVGPTHFSLGHFLENWF